MINSEQREKFGDREIPQNSDSNLKENTIYEKMKLLQVEKNCATWLCRMIKQEKSLTYKMQFLFNVQPSSRIDQNNQSYLIVKQYPRTK